MYLSETDVIKLYNEIQKFGDDDCVIKLEVSKNEVLDILSAVRSEYRYSKWYYKKYTSAEERTYVTSPNEWEVIHDKILKQIYS